LDIINRYLLYDGDLLVEFRIWSQKLQAGRQAGNAFVKAQNQKSEDRRRTPEETLLTT